MSWAEKRASYLKSEKKEIASPASAKPQSGWAEKRQNYLQKQEEINSIDWNEVSAGLKKDLADVLGGGDFDKDKSRELVENYAGVQFRIFDENLKKGRTAIKPVGENLSNLFKAHGYDFNELYPDLAENFATGNIEGYAYGNSEAFKEKYDKRAIYEMEKGALLDKAVATNQQREHERNAEKIAAEDKEKAAAYNVELERLNGEVDWNSLTPDERLGVSNANKIKAMQNTGYYNNPVGFSMTPEEAAERSEAKQAYVKGVYADEALYAIRTMREVMAKPDFEEKSKTAYGESLPEDATEFDSFKDTKFEDGTTIAINSRGFTEDQYKVYMYLLNTEGVEAATRFEDGIKNTLNSMEAERASQIFQDMEKGNPLEKVASGIGQVGYAFGSGVEGIGQAFKGIGDTFTGDTEYFMPGVSQMVTAKNREDASFAGRIGLGAVEGTPQVLGTAALGTINPVLGTVFLGATAYGSAYVDAINSGATRGQAMGFGVTTALLEIALERFVGSTIEGFGSSLSGRIGKGISKTKLGNSIVSSLDNLARVHPKAAAGIRVFGNWFGNSSSESVEEYLSETASPILRNIFLGENKDFTLWSDEQKEAGLIGFITSGILEGFRSTSAISDVMAGGYRLTRQRILNMSDSGVIAEYMNGISDAEIASMLSIEDPSFNNLDGQGMMAAIEQARSELASEINPKEARQELLERENFISSTVAVSEYAKQGLSYDEAIKKAEKLGVDISGLEAFTKSAYDLGKAEANKADVASEVQKLINQGESSSYISAVTGMSINDVNNAKSQLFSQSLSRTSMSDFDKANAIKRYTLKEQALDRMYEMGNSGLRFDASMSAGIISDADAYKAFTRGENAYKARQEEATSRIFDEAPTAPVIDEDGDNLKGDTLDDSSIVLENDEASYPYDEKSVIDGYEKAVDNKILDFINRIREITDDSRKKKQYLVFSDVKPGSRLSKDIKRLTGVTADGFKNRLDGNDFLHIEADHGKNGRADHSMANDNDLARIGFVIDNYDTIEIVTDKNGTPDTDYEHQNSDQTPSKMVKMSKKINGTYYVVESVPDSKSKSVYIKSAYISKDGSKPRPLNVSKDPQLTSETLYSQNATTDDIISDSSSDVNTTINSIGSNGTALYNRILEPIAKDTKTKQNLVQYREGFAHVYESGLKGVPYKRSKAGPLHIKEINAIYEAGKKDAQARANVNKKANAKVIKDDSFTKAKVSKRTERILGGVAKVVGRDIRFSDDIEGNAKINLETGEIIISTKAKSGHTWAMIHEVYHALVVDSPAEAAVLKKTVLDIARKNPALYKKLRGIYADRYIGELLDENGKLRADAEEYLTEEMAADLIGYTLSDPEILANLTGEQRNVLQKFVDKLVSMFSDKNLKAASEYLSNADADIRAIFKDVAKEADTIAEQFKSALDTSKKAEKNTVERDGVVRSSLIFINGKNKNYGIGVLLDDTLLDNLSESERIDMVKEYVKELGGSELIAYDSNNKEVKIKLADSSEKFTNKNGARVHVNKDLTSYLKNKVKQESIVLIDELVIASKYSNSDAAKHPHGWLDNNGVNKWEYWKVYIQDKNKTIWEATLNIANATNGEKYLYDIYPIKMVERAGTSATTTTNNNYTQKNGNVNRNSRDIFTKADEDYMKTVESGDMEVAQRMVDEAAKAAGYSVRVYHGTNKFGFTQLDVSKSDDGISFFATEAIETAGTYSDRKSTRAINEKQKKPSWISRASAHTKVALAEKGIQGVGTKFVQYCSETAGAENELNAEYVKETLRQNLNDISSMKQSSLKAANRVETQLMSRFDSYAYNAYVNLGYSKGGMTFDEFKGSKAYNDLEYQYTEHVNDIFYSILGIDVDVKNDAGIYDLYANIDNHLIFDAQGNNWNNIPLEDVESSFNDWYANEYDDVYKDDDKVVRNTRTLVAYAKAKGYDGVTFKNIKDSGDETDVAPATIYAFFNPEVQVKSADPVAYDDDGNVIPLSERFNPEKKDIRWSKDVFSEDGVRSSRDINDDFSYKKLISKPDMKITLLKPVEKNTINKYQNDKTLFAKEMKHKATVDGKHPLNTDTQTWLFNKDTQSDILVGKDSFKHGTTRGIDATYIEVCQNLSDILYNAVAVNSLKPRENTNGGTVYLSIAENADNYVVVRFAVEKRTQKLLDYEVLSAITKNSIKKEDVGVKAPRLPIGTNAKKGSATSSTISIADFLDVVKDYYSDVLSNDVLKHFGIVRKHSALSDSVKHSKELFTDDRTMSAEDIENDEIEQMVQSIISSDDLSDADVKAIREEIINSKKLLREKLLADITTTNLARWGMDIGRSENAPKMSIDEAVKKVKDSFGITITDAKDASVAGSAVSSYNENTRTIRTKFRNDLPAICHSLGYHIDNTLGVVDKVIEQTAKVRELDGDGVSEWEQELRRLSNYEGDDTRKAIKEGFAEFIRLYLVSKNLAQADAPVFYSEFESMLQEDERLQNAVETSAQAVSGYFVQSAEDRGSGAIMTKAEWDKLNKESLGKRLKSTQTRLIQAVTDSFYAIKATEKAHGVFDLTTSDTGYVKASMTRTSRSRAARILMDAFYDADGNRIGDSFLDIIKPLGKENSKKMEDFGNYLTFVHAIEWIEPNKLEGKKTSSGKDIYNAKAKGHVFKDETLNDANELRRIIASMEERHPDFKAIAKKVYEYQDNLMKYYLIPSGALSQDQAETFRAQYPHYVPFNRFNSVFGDATGKRNRSLFANLRNPIQKADGGDAPIRNPIESIMNSTYAAVDFYDKQATMAAIASEFAGMNAIPGVMSRIYSTKQLQELEDKGKNPFSIEEGKTLDENKDASFNPVADKEKGIVYRWVNGEKWFYQVYDKDLFNALSSLDVEQLTKGFRFLNTMSNVLKRTMTMWNPIFSTGNAIKDFQSFKKNTVTNAGVLGSLGMYVSSARSFLAKDEYFRLYRAMGGMDSTRLNADEDSLRKAVRGGVRKNTRLFSPSEMRELWNYSKVEWFKRVDLVRNLVDSFFAFNDFIETLPRLAEFKNSMNMSESKGDSQLAFYRSQDVTTDFSRKGTKGRKINAVFLFSNANLQGIDKSIRTYTESGYTRKNAKGELSNANIAKKIISNLTFDLLMTALIAFLHRDEEDREEYRRLSDFTKNNYYCFHTGDGNFIKIPKGENSSLPQTLTQRLWDASQGDDIDLSELGGYVWECFFPDFLPNAVDVFTEDSLEGGLKAAANAPLNKTPISVFTDVLLNRDYKGDEIVPDYMGNYENNFEKYTSSTSKFSVDLAKSLYTSAGIDISPMSLDHFFGAAGWYGSFATKMMPAVSDDGNKTFGEKFWNAFGLERKFTADARYSTDLLNDFYDERDKIAGKAKVKLTSKNLIQNEKYQAMSSFMSGYNKASRNGSQEQQRLDRRMLQMMLEDFGKGDYTEGEEYVMKLYDSTKNDKVFKTTFPKAEFTANVKVGKKKVKKEVSLDANTYAQFCADISNMREKVRILVRDMGLDDVTAASFLEGAYTDIDADMKIKYAEMYGKDPVAVEDSSKKTEVSKQDQTWFNDAYEEALNNEIWK